jgi:hypothetical protein
MISTAHKKRVLEQFVLNLFEYGSSSFDQMRFDNESMKSAFITVCSLFRMQIIPIDKYTIVVAVVK